MTRRAAIAALVAFAAFAQARGEWVTEVVTNEYDCVEYLQGDGKAYIDTGVVAGDSLCDVAIRYMVLSWSQYAVVYGYEEAGLGAEMFRLAYAKGNTSTYSFRSDWNWNGTVSYNEIRNLSVTKSGNIAVLNNNGSIFNITINKTFTVSLTHGLFARNVNGSFASMLNGRIYFARFSRDGSTIRNFAPILDNGTPKMLDLVSGETFANSGTGSFTYGSITGKVYGVKVTRTYRPNPPMRSFDAAHPFNNPTARTRLGGTGSGEDGTTLRPTAHFDIKKNKED